MSDKNENFTVGALIGFIAGALAGVLLAPAGGSETRKKVRKEYEDKVAPVLDKISDRAKELSGPMRKKFVDEIEQLTDDINEKVEDVEDAVEEKAKSLKQSLQSGELKKRFFNGMNSKKP